jgi:hypothetical protein
MASIILLAFGACVFPTLLACVAIIISRPAPRLLLLAFYAGGLLTSVSTGLVVLTVFTNGDEVLGNTSSSAHPTTSIVTGVVALLGAWLMASTRGHAMLAQWRTRHGHHRKRPHREGPSWAERTLGRASWRIALLVGAIINLPGPLYVLALGEIARGGYSVVGQVALVLLFNAIMFLLLEVPLVGYLLAPETTTARVAAMSRWLNANGLRITGWLVGLAGAGVLLNGIAALAG